MHPARHTLSRFYQRWLAADPARLTRMEELQAHAIDGLDLTLELEREMAGGLPLARGMRRLRNLLVAALARRDLDGQADLNEVVTAMTRFADFAIRTHLAALMAEQVALHGMPIGDESG